LLLLSIKFSSSRTRRSVKFWIIGVQCKRLSQFGALFLFIVVAKRLAIYHDAVMRRSLAIHDLEARTSFWCRRRTVIAKLPGLRLRPRWANLQRSPRHPSRINGINGGRVSSS